MSKEAMKLALEAAYLAGFDASGEGYNAEYPFDHHKKDPEQDAVWVKDRDNALREALAKPDFWEGYVPEPTQKRSPNCGTGHCSCIECVMEPAQQEPMAWMHPANPTCVTTDPTAYARGIPLYKSPPAQRTWVGLTDDERRAVRNSLAYNSFMTAGEYAEHFQKATEAKLREKNT